MNELILTILLFIPPASQGVRWDVNEVPNQVVVTFKSGVKASYSTIQVPCNTEAIKKGWVIYETISNENEVCYLTDISSPVMVRGPWRGVMIKTYERDTQ
jgi:hypothetical protein